MHALGALALALAMLPFVGPAQPAEDDARRAPKRPADRAVMFVGNNWAGTATVVDARTHRVIKTLNIVPDREEELLSIYAEPDKLAFYMACLLYTSPSPRDS